MRKSRSFSGAYLIVGFVLLATAAQAPAAVSISNSGDAAVEGTDIEGETNGLTILGQTIECADSSYEGEAVGGGSIDKTTEAITLTPTFDNEACKSSSGPKATIHMNGCDFVFHIGEAEEKEEETVNALTADLVCAEGEAIDIELFLSSSNENINSCTIVILPQKGLSGATLAGLGESNLELGGQLSGMATVRAGLCGGASEENAYDLAVELEVSGVVGEVTVDGPTYLDGTDLEESPHTLTAFGEAAECSDTGYHGEAVGGGAIDETTNAITLTPTFANETCKTPAGSKTTVQTNGCDYVAHVGSWLGEGDYATTLDIACPEGEAIEYTIFLSPTDEDITVCSVVVPPQEGLGGAALSDDGEGGLELSGEVVGVEASKSGLCGSESTEGGALDLMAEFVPSGQIGVDGPTYLDGTDLEESPHALTVFGQTTECSDTSYHGEAVGGGAIEETTDAITLMPTFANETCKTGSGLKMTVQTNGCDYVARVGSWLGEGDYATTLDIACPEGEAIKYTIFLSPTDEDITVCSVVVPPQEGLGGAALSDDGEGGLELSGEVVGVEASKSGLCGSESTEGGALDLTVGLAGTNEEEESTEVELFG